VKEKKKKKEKKKEEERNCLCCAAASKDQGKVRVFLGFRVKGCGVGLSGAGIRGVKKIILVTRPVQIFKKKKKNLDPSFYLKKRAGYLTTPTTSGGLMILKQFPCG
jgi:hypothetical protein